MRALSVFCIILGVGMPATAAFARGGMGMHSMGMALHPMAAASGGPFGTSAATPGTNSLGTALSSSSFGESPMKGPELGTSPAIDQEDAKVNKMIGSICRGC
jgi:hypothetical protein